jgi:hypothetical protein
LVTQSGFFAGSAGFGSTCSTAGGCWPSGISGVVASTGEHNPTARIKAPPAAARTDRKSTVESSRKSQENQRNPKQKYVVLGHWSDWRRFGFTGPAGAKRR